MKNITVSVDDETYRRARIKAAENDTSVSAMVREYLTGIANSETEFERLKQKEAALRSKVGGYRASDRLSRDELHERNR
jgi:plasmid stability protein